MYKLHGNSSKFPHNFFIIHSYNDPESLKPPLSAFTNAVWAVILDGPIQNPDFSNKFSHEPSSTEENGAPFEFNFFAFASRMMNGREPWTASVRRDSILLHVLLPSSSASQVFFHWSQRDAKIPRIIRRSFARFFPVGLVSVSTVTLSMRSSYLRQRSTTDVLFDFGFILWWIFFHRHVYVWMYKCNIFRWGPLCWYRSITTTIDWLLEL